LIFILFCHPANHKTSKILRVQNLLKLHSISILAFGDLYYPDNQDFTVFRMIIELINTRLDDKPYCKNLFYVIPYPR